MRNRLRLFNLVKGDARFEIKAEAPVAQVYLYDEISPWGVQAADFVSELATLGGADFDLHVNSPGGDVFEGLAMLNTLRTYPGQVTAIVDGIAASAASFLIMGADEIVTQPNSEIMIHDAWGLCMGNAADMIDMASRLDKVSDNIADVYAGRGHEDAAVWRERMRQEVWYSAEEAVEVGLADRVGSKLSLVSDSVAYDLSKLRNNKQPATEMPVAARLAVEEDDEFEWIPTSELLGAFEEAMQ